MCENYSYKCTRHLFDDTLIYKGRIPSKINYFFLPNFFPPYNLHNTSIRHKKMTDKLFSDKLR